MYPRRADAPDPAVSFPSVSDPKPAFKEFLDSLGGVEFWDFDRFNLELTAAGMPELPVRLLEDAEFVWMLNGDETSGGFDGWVGLAKAVDSDAWQLEGVPTP